MVAVGTFVGWSFCNLALTPERFRSINFHNSPWYIAHCKGEIISIKLHVWIGMSWICMPCCWIFLSIHLQSDLELRNIVVVSPTPLRLETCGLQMRVHLNNEINWCSLSMCFFLIMRLFLQWVYWFISSTWATNCVSFIFSPLIMKRQATVDGRNPANQLSLVVYQVYPIIYKVSNTSQVVGLGMSSILQCNSQVHWLHECRHRWPRGPQEEVECGVPWIPNDDVKEGISPCSSLNN